MLKCLDIKESAGFTAIELITSIFVFSIVGLVFGDTLAGALHLQRRAYSIQQVEENTNFVLEAMAKEVRVSQMVGADTSCPASPVNSLTIIHPVNGTITYSLSGTDVQRRVNVGETIIDTIFNTDTVQFTRLQFCIQGNNFLDQRQARVTVLVGVQSANAIQRATMDVQTTVSSRLLSN